MALRTDQALEGLNTSSNLPSSSAWTLFLRFQRKGAGGASGEILWASYDTSYDVQGQLTIDGGVLEYFSTAGAYAATGSSSLANDVWYDVAVVNAGSGATDLTVYFGETNGSWSVVDEARDPGSGLTALAEMYLGFQSADYFPNVIVDDFRYWTTALSAGELAVERVRTTTQRTSGLHWFLPMDGGTLDEQRVDESGNGYDWAISGSPGIVDGPTIVAPGPALSAPGVQDVTATSAVPKVTVTF